MEDHHKEVTPDGMPDKFVEKEDVSAGLVKTRGSQQARNEKVATSRLSKLIRNIKDHLFDFILLFLAVFCGFMADNWRENLSEHQREKNVYSFDY